MAVAYRASSAVVSQTAANPSIAMPPGTVQNDIMVCVVYKKDNVVSTMPAGWTLKTSVNNGTINRIEIWWKRAGAGEAGPYTITASGTLAKKAFISSFSGCVTSGDPFNAFGAAQANASSLTITAAAITPTTANSMILFACGYGDDWTGIGLASGSNPTFANAAVLSDATGTDSSIALDYGTKTDTTSTGSRTKTATGTAALNCASLLALTPEPAATQVDTQYNAATALQKQLDTAYSAATALQKEVDKTYQAAVTLQQSDIGTTYQAALQVQKQIDTQYQSAAALQKQIGTEYLAGAAVQKSNLDTQYSAGVVVTVQVDTPYQAAVALQKEFDTQYSAGASLQKEVGTQYQAAAALQKQLDTTYSGATTIQKEMDTPYQGSVAVQKEVGTAYLAGAALQKQLDTPYQAAMALQKQEDTQYLAAVRIATEGGPSVVDTQYQGAVTVQARLSTEYLAAVALQKELGTEYLAATWLQKQMDTAYMAAVVIGSDEVQAGPPGSASSSISVKHYISSGVRVGRQRSESSIGTRGGASGRVVPR